MSGSSAATESSFAAALRDLPAVVGLSPTWRRVFDAASPGEGDDKGGGPGVDEASFALLSDTLASLQRLNAEGDVILAAILHDLPTWQARVEPRLAKEWPSLATLLEGQRAAAQVWTLHAAEAGGRNAEGLRRLLLAIVRDLRVVPVLLARQLAHMRDAGKLPEPERKALARLTRDIHAPLANRLGIWQLKWELEDLSLRHLEPETYKSIARWLDEKRGGRERYIEAVKRALGDALKAQGIEAEVAGRPKHITSIWKKMQKKGVPIDELYDLRAVRVLVKDIPSCYAALGAVHALWVPIPSEFDDYIARPKRNDYRSLHTAVVGPEGKTLEVQIRTHDMHAQAELGVAAHWRYKEGRSAPADAGLDRKIEWMRRLLDGGRDESEGAEQSLHGALDSELVEDRIYTLTPQGDVVDLPNGATPLDFAYHVHTMVGHRCRGAKVDGRIVPLDYKLRTGQRIEILTAKTAEPRRDWLQVSNGFLASGRSRDKVRAWFHKLDRARNLQAGREILEKDLRRMSLLHADLAPILTKFSASSADDLYVQVALGDVSPHQIGRALLDHERAQQEASQASNSDGDQSPCADAETRDCARGAEARAKRLGVHGGGRGQFIGADRALLPTAAGRTYRRLSHTHPRRQCASRRLRGVSASFDGTAAARAAGGVGPQWRRAYRERDRRSGRSPLVAEGCEQFDRARRCACGVDQHRCAEWQPRAPAIAIAHPRPRPPRAPARAPRQPRGCGRRTPRISERRTASRYASHVTSDHSDTVPLWCARLRRHWPWLSLLVAGLALATALLREPLADALWPEARAEALRQRAEEALAAGRLTAADGSGARELFEAGIAIDPDRAELPAGLARVAVAAVAQADRAVRDGRFADAHRHLALSRQLSAPRASIDAVAERLRDREAAVAGIDDLLSAAERAQRDGRLDGAADAALPLYRRVLDLQPRHLRALEGREDALSVLLQRAHDDFRRDALADGAAKIATVANYDRGHVDLADAQSALAQSAERVRRQAESDLRAGRLARAADGFEQWRASGLDPQAAEDALANVAQAHLATRAQSRCGFPFRCRHARDRCGASARR